MSRDKRFLHILLSLALVLPLCGNAAAETIDYTGRIYATRAGNLLPLGNGTGVATVEVAGIAAMSGNPPVLFTLGCVGVGHVTQEGDAKYEIYCNFAEDAEDSFDVKGNISDGSGKLEVIGGSGRFAGATGSGKYRRVDDGDEAGSGIVEIKLRTK